MRHRKIKKINKKQQHKVSMLRNMFFSIVQKGHIRTTKSKARVFEIFFNKFLRKILRNMFFLRFNKNPVLLEKMRILKTYSKTNKITLRNLDDGRRYGDFSRMAFIYITKCTI